MKKLFLIVLLVLVCTQLGFAANKTKTKKSTKYYGRALCANPNYGCIKAKGGGWNRLFPDPVQRDLVQRINRTNMYLYRGRKIAVPHNIDKLTVFDISPFPLKIHERGEKKIIVDQEKLAWGAYDRDGKLVKWGPISSGKNYCRDVGRNCTTATGIYYIYTKEGEWCESNIYPVGRGGAKMPYCMFLYKGFALHGSNEVPGYRDSHGCVRLFKRDAQWLNEEFVELPSARNDYKGTKVVIQKLLHPPKIRRRVIRRRVEKRPPDLYHPNQYRQERRYYTPRPPSHYNRGMGYYP